MEEKLSDEFSDEESLSQTISDVSNMDIQESVEKKETEEEIKTVQEEEENQSYQINV